MPSLPGGVEGDLHAEGRFAHRGPRADHRQIARLQTEDQAVKIRNSGQNACHFAAGPPFHIVVYAAGQLVHAHDAPGRRVQTAQSGTQRVGAGVHVLALGQPPAKVAGHGIGAPGPEKAPGPGDVVPRARPRYRKPHAPDQVFRHVRLARVAQGALHAQRLDGLAPLLKPPHAR